MSFCEIMSTFNYIAVTMLAIGGTLFLDDFEEIGLHVEDILEGRADITFATARRFSDLKGYNIGLGYLTDSALTDEQRNGLLIFVREGTATLGSTALQTSRASYRMTRMTCSTPTRLGASRTARQARPKPTRAKRVRGLDRRR